MCECGMDVCKGVNMHSGCGTTSCVSHHVSCRHNQHSSGRSDIIVIKQECECSEQLEGFEGRVAQAEESSHMHLNKDVLDTIEASVDSIKCNGIELANADLSNVDTSGLFGTDGSGVDVQMFTTMLGLEETALKDGSNIDVVEYSEQLGIGDLAKTNGSNIDTSAYSTQLGLSDLAKTDGSNIDAGAYSTQLGLDGLATTDASNIDIQAYKTVLGIEAQGGSSGSSTNVGMFSYFCMITPPAGWLVCNGAEVEREEYSELFATIGETYGAGDGMTTFALPDMRGYFARGLDDGRGVDTGRVLGSVQNDSYRAHSHSATTTAQKTGDFNSPHVATTLNYRGGLGVGSVTVGLSGESETRPKNIALLPCIAY